MALVLRYELQWECKRCGECCLNEDCEHLEMGEMATCKIHKSPDRPLKCGYFPDMPPIVFKNCGYYFLDTWEDDRRVETGRT